MDICKITSVLLACLLLIGSLSAANSIKIKDYSYLVPDDKGNALLSFEVKNRIDKATNTFLDCDGLFYCDYRLNISAKQPLNPKEHIVGLAENVSGGKIWLERSFFLVPETRTAARPLMGWVNATSCGGGDNATGTPCTNATSQYWGVVGSETYTYTAMVEAEVLPKKLSANEEVVQVFRFRRDKLTAAGDLLHSVGGTKFRDAALWNTTFNSTIPFALTYTATSVNHSANVYLDFSNSTYDGSDMRVACNYSATSTPDWREEPFWRRGRVYDAWDATARKGWITVRSNLTNGVRWCQASAGASTAIADKSSPYGAYAFYGDDFNADSSANYTSVGTCGTVAYNASNTALNFGAGTITSACRIYPTNVGNLTDSHFVEVDYRILTNYVGYAMVYPGGFANLTTRLTGYAAALRYNTQTLAVLKVGDNYYTQVGASLILNRNYTSSINLSTTAGTTYVSAQDANNGTIWATSLADSAFNLGYMWVRPEDAKDGWITGLRVGKLPQLYVLGGAMENNTAPAISSVSILNSSNGTTFNASTVLVGWASFASRNSPTLNLSYRWFVNSTLNFTGSLASLAGGTRNVENITTPNLSKGQSWVLEVNVSDNAENAILNSSAISISNSMPTMAANNLSFVNSTASHSFLVNATATDSDGYGDIVGWQVKASDGTCTNISNSQAGNATQIKTNCSGTSYAVVSVSVNFWDTSLTNISQLVVTQYPDQSPAISAVNIYSSAANSTIFNASKPLIGWASFSDADDATLNVSWRWFVNGSVNASGNTTSVGGSLNLANVSPANLSKGQSWQLEVWVNDSVRNSTITNSSAITISNSMPTMASSNLSFVNESSAALLVNATASDDDGYGDTLWQVACSVGTASNVSSSQSGNTTEIQARCTGTTDDYVSVSVNFWDTSLSNVSQLNVTMYPKAAEAAGGGGGAAGGYYISCVAYPPDSEELAACQRCAANSSTSVLYEQCFAASLAAPPQQGTIREPTTISGFLMSSAFGIPMRGIVVVLLLIYVIGELDKKDTLSSMAVIALLLVGYIFMNWNAIL